MAKVKIRDRMIEAIRKHGDRGRIKYHDLARHVFPRDEYPRAWNYPTKGGPPGCFMVLSRAIREHEFYHSLDGAAVVHSTIGLPRGVELKEAT